MNIDQNMYMEEIKDRVSGNVPGCVTQPVTIYVQRAVKQHAGIDVVMRVQHRAEIHVHHVLVNVWNHVKLNVKLLQVTHV